MAAQGINKKFSIIKQSGLGVIGAGAGAQTLRRVTVVPVKETDSYENNEIVGHQQSTGASYGIVKPSIKSSFLLSPGTYKLPLAALLRKDFVTGVTTGALTTITAASTSGAQGTFTRTGGSYLTDGFKIGDIVRNAGWATTGASNNAVNMLIILLTATVMTVTRFDGVAVGAKASGDSVTIAVAGKKTLAPVTDHTNDYFTCEDWYSDLAQSELFGDQKPAKADIALPATGNATINIDWVGLSRTRGTSQILTSPTAETGTNVLTALNGVVWINGAPYTLTSGSLSIDGTTAAGEAEIGSNSSSDLQRGRIKVTGSFTALFKDTTIQDLYDNQTITSIVLVCLDNKSGLADFVTFNLSAIKVFGDAPDDGEKQIIRTYPFTAQINAAGGAALANDNTILSIQDSAA